MEDPPDVISEPKLTISELSFDDIMKVKLKQKFSRLLEDKRKVSYNAFEEIVKKYANNFNTSSCFELYEVFRSSTLRRESNQFLEKVKDKNIFIEAFIGYSDSIKTKIIDDIIKYYAT